MAQSTVGFPVNRLVVSRGLSSLSMVGAPVPCVADDVSPTVTGPDSPVPGTGVVEPCNDTVLVNVSPATVGKPARGPPA